MNVKELIEALGKQDPEATVYWRGASFGGSNIDRIDVVPNEWYDRDKNQVHVDWNVILSDEDEKP